MKTKTVKALVLVLSVLLVGCSKTTDEEIIESKTPNIEKVFAFKYIDNGINSIVQLNPNNGSEIKTIANLGNQYLRIAKYYGTTDEILGEVNENNTKKFYRIKVSDGTISKYNYNGYDDFVIGENKIYAFKYNNNNNSIVELNPINGAEITTLKSVGINYLKNFVFSQNTNTIICENNTTKSLYKINSTNGNTESFNYFGYDNLAISKNGQLYGFKYTTNNNQIVELNTSNGNEIKTIKSVGSKYLKNMFYLNSTNEIVGDLITNSSTHNYFKCKVSDGISNENTFGKYDYFIF
ncbi:hypothetical protein PFY12_12675 [Chryseobacterium camelliae]|uniref:DUF5050 domain-containing protein n=1 Tax=Chryseobacterium camelliae TaxID=1265445 RepID=A0ABY7QL61_9FLAO|nr:hypothetical protein [Chryseobacterium camelliae]WBV59894.1 hypothetical protein PFY12_12675 [Chryseobacterium camelliae]